MNVELTYKSRIASARVCLNVVVKYTTCIDVTVLKYVATVTISWTHTNSEWPTDADCYSNCKLFYTSQNYSTSR